MRTLWSVYRDDLSRAQCGHCNGIDGLYKHPEENGLICEDCLKNLAFEEIDEPTYEQLLRERNSS